MKSDLEFLKGIRKKFPQNSISHWRSSKYLRFFHHTKNSNKLTNLTSLKFILQALLHQDSIIIASSHFDERNSFIRLEKFSLREQTSEDALQRPLENHYQKNFNELKRLSNFTNQVVKKFAVVIRQFLQRATYLQTDLKPLVCFKLTVSNKKSSNYWSTSPHREANLLATFLSTLALRPAVTRKSLGKIPKEIPRNHQAVTKSLSSQWLITQHAWVSTTSIERS